MKTIGETEQIIALYAAVAKAQAEFTPIRKESSVSFGGKTGGNIAYKYADYDGIRQAVVPALAKYGCSIRQPFETYDTEDGTRMGRITTILSHEAGGAEVSTIDFAPATEIKNLGGQTTYLRRYAINCVLGLGAEDAEEDPNEQYKGAPGLGKGQAKKEERFLRPADSKPSEARTAATTAEPAAPQQNTTETTPTAEQPGRYTDAQREQLNKLCEALNLKGKAITDRVKSVTGKTIGAMTESDADRVIADLEDQLLADAAKENGHE